MSQNLEKKHEKAQQFALVEYYSLLNDAYWKLVSEGASSLDVTDKRILYPRFLKHFHMGYTSNFFWSPQHPLSEKRMSDAFVYHHGIPDCEYVDEEIIATFGFLVKDVPKKDLFRFIMENLDNMLVHIDGLLNNGLIIGDERAYLLAKQKAAHNQFVIAEFKLLLEELNESFNHNAREENIRSYIPRVNKLIADWHDDLDDEQKIINFENISVSKIDLENVDLRRVKLSAQQLSGVLGLHRVKGLEGNPLWEDAKRLKKENENPLSEGAELQFSLNFTKLKRPPLARSVATDEHQENISPANSPPTSPSQQREVDKFYIYQAFDAIEKKHYEKLMLLVDTSSAYEKTHAVSLERNLEVARFELKLLELELHTVNAQVDKLKDFYSDELKISIDELKKILSAIPDATLKAYLQQITKENVHTSKTCWIDHYSFNLPAHVAPYLQLYRQRLCNVTAQYSSQWLPQIRWWQSNESDDPSNSDLLLNGLLKRKKELLKKMHELTQAIIKLINENIKNSNKLAISNQVKTMVLNENIVLRRELRIEDPEETENSDKAEDSGKVKLTRLAHLNLSADVRHPETGETLLYCAVKARDLVSVNILLNNSACLFKVSKAQETPFALALSLLDEQPQIFTRICMHLSTTPLNRLIYPQCYSYVLQNKILNEMIEKLDQLKAQLDKWIIGTLQPLDKRKTNNQQPASEFLSVAQRNVFVEVYNDLYIAANELSPQVFLNQLKALCSRYDPVKAHPMKNSGLLNDGVVTHPMHNSDLINILRGFVPQLEELNSENFHATKLNYVRFSMNSQAHLEQKLSADPNLLLLSPRKFENMQPFEDQERRRSLDEKEHARILIRRNSVGKRSPRHARSSSAPAPSDEHEDNSQTVSESAAKKL